MFSFFAVDDTVRYIVKLIGLRLAQPSGQQLISCVRLVVRHVTGTQCFVRGIQYSEDIC